MSDPMAAIPLSCGASYRAAFAAPSGVARLCCRLLFVLIPLLLLASGAGSQNAWAQAAAADTATLIVRVRSNQSGLTPITGAAVNLSSETERPRSRSTATNGLATFTTLPTGTYSIVVTAVGFRTPPKRDNVVVAAGQTVNVDFFLEPVGPTEVNAIGTVELLERTNTSEYTRRSRAFWTEFPLIVGNQQSLNRILRSVPGFVLDSLDQVHARGESPITNATYLDGFLVPQFAALPVNRAFFLPDSIDLLDIQTGGYAAEIGQASGSVTNITTRQTPYYNSGDIVLKAGEYGTTEDYITFGGSSAGNRDRKLARQAAQQGTLRTVADRQIIGRRVLPPVGSPSTIAPRNLSYLVTLSQRYTDNGSEAPQPGKSTPNNNLASEGLFAKVDYKFNERIDITGLINYVSGRTQSPNRTGLDSSYGPFGQGFGFGGLQGRQPGLFGGSQDEAGLGIRQKDNNNLNLLQVKQTLKSGARLSASFAYARSAQDVEWQKVGTAQPLANLPIDNPVEYLPTLDSRYDQTSVQVDYAAAPKFSQKRGDIHNFKTGVVYHNINDSEGYQLIPQSQTALNALAQTEPALVPNGSFVGGNFVIDPTNPQTPVLLVSREGYYGGLYLQDTWRIRAPITLNYGARADFYEMNIKQLETGAIAYGGSKNDVSKTQVSPRVNLAVVLPKSRKFRFLGSQPTILRVSYDRLFVTPSLGQGDIIPDQGARSAIPGINGSQNSLILGRSVVPQTTDLYDASLERQFGARAFAKGTVYHKDIKNLVSSQQLIPLLQTGLVSTMNLGDATVDGAEFSFEILPPRDRGGFHGYLTYSNSTTSPKTENEFTNLGRSNSTPFFEWDQNNTLNIGVAYTALSGASAGLNFYYGDGLYASALTAGNYIVRSGSDRDSVSEVNLRLASGPRFLGKRVGAELQVENLLNSNHRFNYNSYLTGTRFQMERRVLFALTGRF